MSVPFDKEPLCLAIKQDPQFCLKCPALAAGILSGQLKLVTLVEHLEDLLTDPEPSQRAAAIQVLSCVLKELPPGFLREDEVHFIATFFCDRLKDHHDVIPSALKGILAVLYMENLPKDLPATILSSLMLNINCQSQRREDRLDIYRILDLLVIPHIEVLKQAVPDLVLQVILAIDGERDPRNLKFLFSMLPSVLRSLPLDHLNQAEEFFEVIACYFPVDFQPAAADKNEVSREDLALGLAECLTAVPAFTNFCIPLLLEKLNSSLQVAKLDSLYLLKEACKKFPASDVSVHLQPIWMSLSREALSGSDLEVRERSRECVTHLLRCVDKIPVVGKQASAMDVLLYDIVSASITALGAVHTSMFMPAANLILAAAKSCQPACEHILRKVMPLVINCINNVTVAAEIPIYLEIFSRFLTVCKSLEVTPQNIPDLSEDWNLFVQLYFTSSEHEYSLVRKEAILGLTTLASTLNSIERQKLYNLLSNYVDNESALEVREQCQLCLQEVGRCHFSEVSTYLLEDKLNFMDIAANDSRFERRLEAQCSLAALTQFSEKVLPNIINLIVLSKDSHKIHVSLISVRKLLQAFPDGNNCVYKCLHMKCGVVPRLIEWWILSIQNYPDSEWANNVEILNEVCFIISSVSRNLEIVEQNDSTQQLMSYFQPESDTFKPFESSSPRHHVLSICLLEAVLGCLHSIESIPDLHKLCCCLTRVAIYCHHPEAITSAGRLCASLLNKMSEDQVIEEILVEISSMLENVNEAVDEQSAVQAASLHGWIIKGLAMRGYISLELWIEKLVSILGSKNNSVALSAAQAFQVIMQDSSLYLNLESHCKIRLLHKQRVFVSALALVKKSRGVPEEGRIAYLLALTHLMTGISDAVLSSNLGEVVPLLLESLALESSTLLEAALNTLQSLLMHSPFGESLSDHLQTMLPRLLPLTKSQHNMKVRKTALSCLYELCNLPLELILPFRDEVISALAPCLGDSKRLVRQVAVKTRSRWLLVAAPGGP